MKKYKYNFFIDVFIIYFTSFIFLLKTISTYFLCIIFFLDYHFSYQVIFSFIFHFLNQIDFIFKIIILFFTIFRSTWEILKARNVIIIIIIM